MPFVTGPAPGELDTSELEALPPPQALPAFQDDSGTGANGPKYTTSEFWSGVGRNTIMGHGITDYRAMQAAGYNPLESGELLEDPSTAIPEDMKPYADKYVGMYTKEQIAYRTFQLRQSQWDQQHGGQSKWSLPANLAAGLVDPIGAGSMFIPVAGETRLANAIRMAAVGTGVSAADEALLSQLDPNWTFVDAMKDVGAGALVSGILGGLIRPHVSANEFGKARFDLNEDLHAPSPDRPNLYANPTGDSAEAIAHDIRVAVEAHAPAGEVRARPVAEAPAAESGSAADIMPAREPEAVPAQGAEIPVAERSEPLSDASAEGVPAGYNENADYHVQEQELTDAARAQFEGLRSEVPSTEAPRATGGGESAEPVLVGSAGGDARGIGGAEGAIREPLPVYRGGRGGPLTPEHFEPTSFGKATSRPSAGLGVWFTNQEHEAARYGVVTEHYLDIRHPLEMKFEELPTFDSTEAATKWRNEQKAKGYDGLVLDASHLGGATHFIPFDFKQVMRPAQAAIAPARTVAEQLERATSPALRRAISDETLRVQLSDMAKNESGWAQVGGKMIRREINGERGNEFEISRTTWIPNEEWWPGRPGGYSPADVSRIVEKALAGERLGPKQQRLIEYMTEVADQRISTTPYLPKPEDFAGAEHVSMASIDDRFEVGMVARLAAIDEQTVETLARHFENDDAGFMQAVRSKLDAYDTDASLASGGAQSEEPLGISRDRSATGGPLAPAGDSAEAAVTSAVTDDTRQPKSGSHETPAEGGGGRQSLSAAAAKINPAESITQLLDRLPPAQRAQFETRIAALELPLKSEPLYAAPGDSTAGAASSLSREGQLELHSLARGGRVLGKALGWFAPGSRALSSPSLAMRKTMMRLIETPEMLEMNVPSEQHPFGLPTPLAVQTLLKRWEGNWAKAFAARDQIFRDYRARPQSEVEGPKMGKHEFNEQVSMAMRRGDAWFVPEVEKAAKATRAIVFDPLKVEAQKLGLLASDEKLKLGGTADSYLMRQYDRAKIQKDQAGWHQILTDGFRAQGLETAEAGDVAHAVTRNILGTELGLLDTDRSVFNAVKQSGRLQERTLKLPDLALEKYLTNDIDTLSHSYLKSLAPQVEMLKMFRDDLRNDGLDQAAQGFRVATPDPQAGPSMKEMRNLTGPAKDITDEYAILKQRALADGNNELANQLDKRLRSDLRDLGAVRDRLYGIYGAPADSGSWIQRAGRVIRSVNALRLLGTATWSHVPDLANIVMKRGLPQTMAAAAKLSSSLEAMNLNRAQMHRIGAALDMIHNSTAAQLGEFGVESSYALQKGLNRATRAFTIATLETPWIATCKMLAGAAAHDEVLEAAGRAQRFSKRVGPDLSRGERTRFNQMGLDQGMLERIAEQFGEYGQNVNGLRFGMTDKWHDQGAAQALDAVSANAAEGSTLSPGAGDTPLWTSHEVGKAVFQFKTFGAVAIRRVTIPLAQGLAHADLRSAQGLATLIAAGALTYTVKQMLSGQPIEKDPARYALEVLDKSNLLGWTSEYFYPGLWQMGVGNFSRWGDRQTWETLGGPVLGAAVDAWDLRLPAKIAGTLRGVGPQITRGDIHRVRRMLPGNQVWYLRRAVNALEGHVGDAMGLAPAPVPGSSE